MRETGPNIHVLGPTTGTNLRSHSITAFNHYDRRTKIVNLSTHKNTKIHGGDRVEPQPQWLLTSSGRQAASCAAASMALRLLLLLRLAVSTLLPLCGAGDGNSAVSAAGGRPVGGAGGRGLRVYSGGAPRRPRSHRVREPAMGFFVGGSSIAEVQQCTCETVCCAPTAGTTSNLSLSSSFLAP
jgi:hypothetical protein